MAVAVPHICLLPVFLSLWMAAASDIDVTLIPEKPYVNDTVILNVKGVTENIRFSTWYKGNNSEANNQILTYNSGESQINGTKNFAEASPLTNGSLQITNLRKEFSGNYTVSIHDDAQLYQKTVYLQVYDKEEGEAGGGLSPGAIVGICIGCAAAVLVAGVAKYVGIKKGSEGPL